MTTTVMFDDEDDFLFYDDDEPISLIIDPDDLVNSCGELKGKPFVS